MASNARVKKAKKVCLNGGGWGGDTREKSRKRYATDSSADLLRAGTPLGPRVAWSEIRGGCGKKGKRNGRYLTGRQKNFPKARGKQKAKQMTEKKHVLGLGGHRRSKTKATREQAFPP